MTSGPKKSKNAGPEIENAAGEGERAAMSGDPKACPVPPYTLNPYLHTYYTTPTTPTHLLKLRTPVKDTRCGCRLQPPRLAGCRFLAPSISWFHSKVDEFVPSCSGSEEGSYLRLLDFSITQHWAWE